MKREIKFRAWDKYGMTLPFTLKEISEKPEVKGQKVLDVKWGEGTVFMQFTGLLDKNGTGIYDGDVIEVNNDSDDDVVRIKCEIKWEIGQWIAYDILGGGTWTRQLYHQPERIEIIGNIYENPELLK